MKKILNQIRFAVTGREKYISASDYRTDLPYGYSRKYIRLMPFLRLHIWVWLPNTEFVRKYDKTDKAILRYGRTPTLLEILKKRNDNNPETT